MYTPNVMYSYQTHDYKMVYGWKKNYGTFVILALYNFITCVSEPRQL
jgi:hypothetical protein